MLNVDYLQLDQRFDKISSFNTNNNLAVDCPIGTHSTAGKCKLCEQGTYQDEIGQVVCKSCPPGLTTKFLGSQDVSSCTGNNDNVYVGCLENLTIR